MPLLIPFILFVVGILLKPVVFRVLAFLGIGIIAFTGGETFLGEVTNQLTQQFDVLPPQVAQIFGILNIDIFVTTIISAYAIKLSYRGLTTLRRTIGVR